jgi:osmotically inducible protein OsmC
MRRRARPACVESVWARRAQAEGALPKVAINAEVDLHLANDDNSLSACLKISYPASIAMLPGKLVESVERLCPCSKATRGNIDVAITWSEA